MRYLVLVCWCSALLCGQGTLENGCAIRGFVLEPPNDAPVPRASVTLQAAGRRERAVEISESDGSFCFRDIPDGRYLLSASKSRYYPMHWGAKGPFENGKAINLNATYSREPHTIRLPRVAVIEGRVLGPGGEPLAQSSVQVIAPNTYNPERPYAVVGRAMTAADGRFRVRVQAKRVYLGASSQIPGTDRLMPARTYYAGANEVSRATPIELQPGQVLRGVELVVQAAAMVQAELEATGVANCNPNFQARAVDAPLAEELSFITSECDPRGCRWTIASTAGEVVVGAACYGPVRGGGLLRTRVTPGKLVIPMQQPGDLAGEVQGLPPGSQGLSVQVNASVLPFGELAKVEQGKFTWKNVTATYGQVSLLNIPDGYYLASARQGSEELGERAGVLRPGEPLLLRVAKLAIVTGDLKGPTDERVTVVAQRFREGQPVAVQVSMVGTANEGYTLRLPAGKYRIAAIHGLVNTEEALSRSGSYQELDVEEGAKLELNLTAFSAGGQP